MDKELKKNILKSSAATSIGTISSMMFQFLTIMIMTRYVTKEDFGIYVLIIVIVNMYNLLAGLGVELTMVKLIASDDLGRKKDVLLPVLLLRTVGAIFFGVVFILTSKYVLHYFDDRINKYIWYILLIFILSNYRDLFYNLMQGLNQFRNYSIINVVSSGFRIVLVIIFIYKGTLDVENLLIIEVLATLQPLIHQIVVIPFKKHFSIQVTIDSFIRVIKFSIPLYINNLVTFFNGRVNIFIIGLYLSPASIANYDVANRVPVALKKLFSSFIIVYFPNLSKLFSQKERESALNFVKRTVGIFSLTVSLLTLFSFLFRNELTTFIFSDRYAEVSLALALLVLNFMIRGFGDLMGYTLVSAGYPSVSPVVNTISSIISLSLSLLFIPIYGYMGAVYALLVMNVISSYLFFRYLYKYDIKLPFIVFVKPFVAFLVVPISFLYSGSYPILVNIFLFLCAIVISWFINSDMKVALNFIVSQIQKLLKDKKG